LEGIAHQSSTMPENMDLASVVSFVQKIQCDRQDIIYDRREDIARSPFIGFWPSDIVTLLRESLLSQCSMAVDRVYGLIGMTQIKVHTSTSRSEAMSGLILDYSRPMEVVFADLARYIMRRERSVSSILCLEACFGGDKIPSWVPDWRKDTSWKPFLFVEYLIRGRRVSDNFDIDSSVGIAGNRSLYDDFDGEPLERISDIPATAPRLGQDSEDNALRLFGYTIARITVDTVAKPTTETVSPSPPRGHVLDNVEKVSKHSGGRIAAPIPTGEVESLHMFSNSGQRNECKVLKLVTVDDVRPMSASEESFISSPYGRLLSAADTKDAEFRSNLLSNRSIKHRRRKDRTIERLGAEIGRLEEIRNGLSKELETQDQTAGRREKPSKRHKRISKRRIDIQKHFASTYLQGVLERVHDHREALPDQASDCQIPELAMLDGKAPELHAQQDPRKDGYSSKSGAARVPSRWFKGMKQAITSDEWEDDDNSSDETGSDDDSEDNSDDNNEDDGDDDDEDDSDDDDDSTTSHYTLSDDERSSLESGIYYSDYLDEQDTSPDWGTDNSTTSYDEYSSLSASTGEEPPDPWNLTYTEAVRGWRNDLRSVPNDAYRYYSASILNKRCNEMKLTEFATCHNAKVGDIIVVVEGAVMPMVLRPLPSHGLETVQDYTFVGVAMLSYNSIPLNASAPQRPRYRPERLFRPQLAVYAHWQALLLAHVKAGTETEFRVI
jgi:hypothetical protein